MRALIKHRSSVQVKDMLPKSLDVGHVRIRVELAGICRTDVYVAQGRIEAPEGLVLGHEVSGTIEDIGSDGADCALRRGQRVGISPYLGCTHCEWCETEGPLRCPNRKMIGVEVDGGFAQYIDVPRGQVHALSSSISAQLAAYLEPIAASLAPINAPIEKRGRGIVYGTGRIARLTKLVLELRGYKNIHLHSPHYSTTLASNAYDFAIETHATPEAMSTLIHALRPRGVLVIKSRAPDPVAFDFRALLAKELTIQATEYASFEDAVQLVESHPHAFDHLFGPVHALEDAEDAWKVAQEDDQKHFFDPSLRTKEEE